MAEALSHVPGLEVNFTQPMAMRLDEVVSGVKADVAVKIFGPDAAVLERLGGQVLRVVAQVPGTADAQVEILSGAAQIEIGIDRDALARYGLHVNDVQEVVETAIGGRQVTEVLDGARRFPLVVRLPDAVRQVARHDRAARRDGAGRRTRAARPARRGARGGHARSGQPRERRTPAGRADQRPRARRRQLRGRGATAAGGRGRAPDRLLPHLGRPVREPAARHGPAGRRGAAVARHHLRAAASPPSTRCAGRCSSS